MTWEDVKAQLDLLASLRGYKPVDEILANNGKVVHLPKKAPENLPKTSIERERMWWNREQ